MVMMTSLPFAVSKPMTTLEIENFVEGSLPNGTIIENVNTGAIAVVNAGMPQYLPYAEGIIPDVSDFVTQEEIEDFVTQGEIEDFVTQQDVDSVFMTKKPETAVPGTRERLLISDYNQINKSCRPLYLGSEGQVLGIVDGALKFRDPPVSEGGREYFSDFIFSGTQRYLDRSVGGVPYFRYYAPIQYGPSNADLESALLWGATHCDIIRFFGATSEEYVGDTAVCGLAPSIIISDPSDLTELGLYQPNGNYRISCCVPEYSIPVSTFESSVVRYFYLFTASTKILYGSQNLFFQELSFYRFYKEV